MKRRRTKDYIQILDALVTSAKKLNFVIKRTHAMIDFEKETKKEYEQRFPSIIVKDCLFHFGQSLFKNFVKHGFKTAYLKNEELQRW